MTSSVIGYPPKLPRTLRGIHGTPLLVSNLCGNYIIAVGIYNGEVQAMTATIVEQKNIVVCDDNDDILGFIYSLLRNAGFGVTTVHGFNELKEALKTVKPDLFILDVFMPECDGFWIAEELQFQGYQVPIIFMTAFDDPAVRLNAPVSGAVEYFVKPVDPDVLIAKIQKAIAVKPSESNWNLKVTESSFE